MDILYDLQNLNYEKLRIKDFEVFAKRGAYAVVKNKKLIGFADGNGKMIFKK